MNHPWLFILACVFLSFCLIEAIARLLGGRISLAQNLVCAVCWALFAATYALP